MLHETDNLKKLGYQTTQHFLQDIYTIEKGVYSDVE